MISIKELQKKAKEILESLDGMAVGDGINVLVLALSWLIEYSVKKYEQKRILRFLEEQKKRNAKVVSIRELTEWIENKRIDYKNV